MVFKIPDWGFMVPIWLLWLWLFNFQVGFHGPGGFLSFFMVLGGSLWFIKGFRFVIHDFRLVFHGPGGFSSFFMVGLYVLLKVPGWFFMSQGWFFMVPCWFFMAFQGFSWFQVSFYVFSLVFHDSRLFFSGGLF